MSIMQNTRLFKGIAVIKGKGTKDTVARRCFLH